MVNVVNSIILEKVNFSYEENEPVLKNINITIEKGKYLAVLGSSGSGKSTLLRLIAGILPKKPNFLTGNIGLFGMSPDEYRERGKLSFMFQDSVLIPNINVRKNIEFPKVLRGEPIDKSYVDDLLIITGLVNHQEKKPSELSGGMKMRVALARSFITKPELLLLDEPFSSLDISWKYELYSYLEKIKEQFNTTIIIVTHDINEAVLLADKILAFSSQGIVMTRREIEQDSNRFFDYEYTNQLLEKHQDAVLGLQTDIVVDGVRSDTDENQAYSVAKYLLKRIEEGTEEDPFVFDKLNSLKKFSGHSEISKQIMNLWNKSSNWKFKQEIIWRLTDNPNLPMEYHQEIYNFIYDDFDRFEERCKSQQYFRTTEIVNMTRDRINSSQFPESKAWLYLVYLYAMAVDTEMSGQALNFIENYVESNSKSQFLKYINPLLILFNQK